MYDELGDETQRIERALVYSFGVYESFFLLICVSGRFRVRFSPVCAVLVRISLS